MLVDQGHWYAVYTKPRWEKKVFRLLTERGLEAYCPLNRVKKKWSDRMRLVEEPLFKSYVFVKILAKDFNVVRMVNGVVNFVYWLGKPAVIKNAEIEVIRKFLNEYDEVRVEPFEPQTDGKVIIRQGAFMDKEAVVKKILNNKVQVVIESIGYSLIAVIDKSNLTVLGKR